MRNFLLYRKEDETGISGKGVVAEGLEFSNKKCVICWCNRAGSIGVYDNIDEVKAIHGHAGKTIILWRDYELALRAARSTIDNFWEFGLEADFESQVNMLSRVLDELENFRKK
jgi:hypothetical protein